MTQNNRFKMIPAVYILLRQKDEVLLIRRFQTGYMDGHYTLPSGHHDDDGLYLIESAIREAREEIGVEINPQDLKLIHTMHRPKAGDGQRIDFFFETTTWTGEPRNCEPNKCDELKWVQLDEVLNQDIIPYLKVVFQHIQTKSPYSDTDLN